jgi:hypothetical protein
VEEEPLFGTIFVNSYLFSFISLFSFILFRAGNSNLVIWASCVILLFFATGSPNEKISQRVHRKPKREISVREVPAGLLNMVRGK